ncbi:MAG: head GIN domain-containing protein [Bacteroidota bacterium]
MKKALVLIIVTGLIYGLAAGQTVKETRDLKGFTSVGFGVPGNLYIKIGPQFSVELEGSSGDLREVETVITGERLQIKHDNWRFDFREKVNVYVTMPELEGLGVSGSGRADIQSTVKTEDLDLSVSGSGNIYTADLEVENLECSISGSGNMKLGGGSAADTEVSISGSGSFYGDLTKCETMEVHVSGSGNCTCNVTESLEASVSGSGNVTYSGNPRVDARVSGSGRVRTAN